MSSDLVTLKEDMLRDRCGYADLAVRALLDGAKNLMHGLTCAITMRDEESKTRALLACAEDANKSISRAQEALGALKHMALYAGPLAAAESKEKA